MVPLREPALPDRRGTRAPPADSAALRVVARRRLVIAALTWKAITAPAGVADPTASDAHLSHGAVV